MLTNLDKKSREAFLTAAQYIAETDRMISGAEKEWLKNTAEKLGFSLSELPGSGKLDEAVAVLRQLSLEERTNVVNELEALAMCDNEYNSSEQIVMNAIRDLLNVE